MRVLFLSQIVPFPPHGGVLQRGYHLLRDLGRGADVHLLAFVHPDEMPTEAARAESMGALRQFCRDVEYFPLWPKASPLHRVAALGVSAASSKPFSVIAHCSRAVHRRVSELLSTGSFDVLHIDTIALSQFVPVRRTVPAVLTHHNIESMLLERRAQVERRTLARRFLLRESRKLAAYEAAVAPQFDVNILMSPVDAGLLAERVPGVRTAVVPNGVDVDYFAPDAAADEMPALIYTGGMNMFANLDAVMHFVREIWPAIRSQRPDATFYAIGQDPPRQLLEAQNRDPRIVVTGYVTDIRPFVRRSTVYVVPLRVGGGTRLKVLDAMAMGKAIVSTSIGCEGISARPGEHLVVADTAETFAAATLALLGDENRRRALGRSARALVERQYAWRIVGAALRDAYREAIARRARKPVASASLHRDARAAVDAL